MVTGRWSTHSNYGKQFEAEFLDRMMPQSASEILAYLSGRVVKGLAPKAPRELSTISEKTPCL